MTFTGLIAPLVDPDDRPAWLGWRRGGIGASDLAAILGWSPWSSPMALYLEKTGQVIGDDTSEHLRWGRLLEDAIAAEFAEREGLHVAAAQLCVEHGDLRWPRATLDRLVYESPVEMTLEFDSAAIGVLEIKNTFIGEDWSAGIPDMYAVQGQWQLFVTGLERLWFAVLFGGRRLKILPMDRDQRAIDNLVEVASEFWQRVVEHRPPPVDSHKATSDALQAAWAGEVDNDDHVSIDDLAAVIGQLRSAKGHESNAKADVAKLENEIKVALGDKGVGTIDGDPVVTWKASRAFDETRFRAAHPDLWEKHHKFDPSSLKDAEPKLYDAFLAEGEGSRRFNLVKQKENAQ